MFDNFLQEQYHSSDPVFTHPQTLHQIYIGDVQAALDCNQLKQKNITTVVTAARDMDHVKFNSNILHIVYPLLDGKNQDIAVFFDTFYNLVENNIDKGNILVHCAAGISRSSTLVISYIMKFKGWGFKEAIAEVRKHRPTVLPNLGFERQLKKYEQVTKFNNKPSSRIVRKLQDSNASSGKQMMLKTQLMPNFDGLGIVRQKKDKFTSGNVAHYFDKGINRQKQVLKVYNNHARTPNNHNRTPNHHLGNDIKLKKFVITKKAASFSREPAHKNLMIDAIRKKNEPQSGRRIDRPINSSLQSMKAIYLAKKTPVERHNTTERSETFYNLKTGKLEL